MKHLNFKIFTLLICTSIFLFSCNKDDLFEAKYEINKISKSANYRPKLTEDEAIKNLQSFLNELDQSSEGSISTRNKPERIIDDVQVIGKKVELVANNDKSNLRNLSSTIQMDTILYLINFEDAGGFAIVSADERSNKIYAIIDEGALDINDIDKVDNPGFNMFMENAIAKELSTIETYDSNNEDKLTLRSNPYVTGHKLSPRLKTKWGQDEPYNKFSSNGVTGCVPTAIAQIFSYYCPINNVNYDDNGVKRSSDLNWNNILSDCENSYVFYGALTNNGAPQSSLQVAHLMRYIGIGIGAYYDDYGETSASSIKAISWLRNSVGFSKSMKLVDYDAEAAYNALTEGNLIYVSGSSGGATGHAWVGDGMFLLRYVTMVGNGEPIPPTYEYYLHCNWGWNGRCDGYYLDFDLSTGAPEEDIVNPEYIDRPGSVNTNYNTAKRMAIVQR
ncbi:MAG: C10 family peptidase [Tannerella sp.]|jgi:hypothetical protein|nr:C10 family peptidase [Tannerella sp.]